MATILFSPGGCFNIKMSYYQYKNSHYKDRTVSWLIFIMGIPMTWIDSLKIETSPDHLYSLVQYLHC